MRFTTLLNAALALATTAFSQSTRLQFTSVPGPFTIGKPSTISWSGGDPSSPVTLTLREGSSTSVSTIGTLASNLKNTQNFTWTPSAALVPADDYALQIEQGLDSINYSGMFSIQSAAAGGATTIYAVAGSSTVAISTVAPNATSTITLHAGSAASTGTVSVSRNTTFVSQTLASTGSASKTATATTTTATTSSSAGAAAKVTAMAGSFGAIAAAAAVYLL